MQISKSILTLLKKERKLREIYTQVSGFTEVRNSTSDHAVVLIHHHTCPIRLIDCNSTCRWCINDSLHSLSFCTGFQNIQYPPWIAGLIMSFCVQLKVQPSQLIFINDAVPQLKSLLPSFLILGSVSYKN